MILKSLGMLTCPIFGSTTGLFAAVLGRDIFSVPYYKVMTRKKNSIHHGDACTSTLYITYCKCE